MMDERMILTFPLFVVLFGAWFFNLPARREVLIAIAVAYAGLAIMFFGRLDTAEEVSVYEAGGVLQRFAKDFLGQA